MTLIAGIVTCLRPECALIASWGPPAEGATGRSNGGRRGTRVLQTYVVRRSAQRVRLSVKLE